METEMEIKTHPIYDNYEFNTLGQYRKIGNTDWLLGTETRQGYKKCILSTKTGEKKKGSFSVHRAMWETFKYPIPDNYVIDHLDSNPRNNKLENLDCVTREINSQRAQKNNGAFREKAKKAHTLRRFIKSINILTGEEKYFYSKSQAGKHFSCSPALVYLICEKLNNSKTFGGNIKFEYCETVPTNYIKVPDARIGKSKYTSEEKKELMRRYAKRQYERKKALLNASKQTD